MEAGLEKIPAIIIEPRPEDLLVLGLIENIQREELTPLEEAEAYERLQKERGMTHEEIAETVGKSRVAVTNCIRLLGLPPIVKEFIASGKLSAGHGRALLMFSDFVDQIDLARKIVKQGLSVREIEKLSKRSREKSRKRVSSADPRILSIMDIGERMSNALGIKIKAVPRKTGARFIIDCTMDDEIETMIDKLGLR